MLMELRASRLFVLHLEKRFRREFFGCIFKQQHNNKTTMTLAVALALGASVFAAIPQEMVAAKDWESLSMCGFATITNYTPKANMADVYSAYLTTTNCIKAAELSLIGYASTPEQCYADVKAKWPSLDAFYAAWRIAGNSKINNLAWQLEIAEEHQCQVHSEAL